MMMMLASHATRLAEPKHAPTLALPQPATIAPSKQRGKLKRATRQVEHGRSQSIDPSKVHSRDIKDFMELIETVARVEASRLPRHLITYDEIVNIGALTLYLMFTKNPEKEYNVTYLSTAIKWAVRNELRYRYKWYGIKTNDAAQSDEEISHIHEEEASDTYGFDDDFGPDRSQVREAIYESILSVDGMMEADNPHELRDDRATPEEAGEFSDIASIIRAAMHRLPDRERNLIEARFFQHKRMREIGEEFNISPSRASRVVQGALDKLKKELVKHGIESI
ncbi:MAG: sigma-70 family RNA polymerase sigma factor [Vampirovibrionales bacterium]